MPFTLAEVVPWGRSFDEYVRMFFLAEADFAGRILGCADGPASFNAEATARGYRVISCDPSYCFQGEEFAQRIAETSTQILTQLRANREDYRWEEFPTPEAVGERRMAAMRRFLADYPEGRQAGRYVEASLPALPFGDASFSLALCSHFLFLYSDHLTLDFHLSAIRELCRVAREVRIFPLVTLAAAPSPYLEPVVAMLRASGYMTTIEQVPYEFQRGAKRMLRIGRG
jgi:hypothetical protein